ncbi:MAG: hypothetical protein SFZ02_00655 [bacterium]|nr:hypothetical protein [bacterium]
MDFKINTQGIIKNGEYKGWYILIEPFSENTKAFLIFFSNQPLDDKPQEGKIVYDNFADDEETVGYQIEGLDIDWDWCIG